MIEFLEYEALHGADKKRRGRVVDPKTDGRTKEGRTKKGEPKKTKVEKPKEDSK